MPTIQLTVYTYNQLPARQRKTENDKRYVLVDGKEWREVVFIKQGELKGPICRPIPAEKR